jgi:uncharacterized membrane protein
MGSKTQLVGAVLLKTPRPVTAGLFVVIYTRQACLSHKQVEQPLIYTSPNNKFRLEPRLKIRFYMALLSSILGFSLFGLGARVGQLGIQKRNLLESACVRARPSLFNSLLINSCKNSLNPFLFFCWWCVDRPGRAPHRDARFWLSRLLGTSMGRARGGAHS